jgi:hypothetical protein
MASRSGPPSAFAQGSLAGPSGRVAGSRARVRCVISGNFARLQGLTASSECSADDGSNATQQSDARFLPAGAKLLR